MGSCYSGDHIARDNIHSSISTCNTEGPQQKNRLGTANDKINLETGGGLKLVLLDRNHDLCLCSSSKHLVRTSSPRTTFVMLYSYSNVERAHYKLDWFPPLMATAYRDW